jgi:membrane protease YdiL (CAAX protease family)
MSIREWVRGRPLTAFLILAFALSWWPWPLYASGVFTAVGPFHAWGPLLAAPIVTAVGWGGRGLREWAARLVRWRVGWVWYLAALVIPVAAGLLAVALNDALGAPAPDLSSWSPWYVLPLALAVRMVNPMDGPFGEEPGWRGFAQPRIQEGRPRIPATLALGAIVAVWHLPLVVSGTEPVPLYALIGTVASTVWYAWMLNRTGGSVLLTLLMHSAEGLVRPASLWATPADQTRAMVLYTAVQAAVAVALLALDRVAWRTPAEEAVPIGPRGRRAPAGAVTLLVLTALLLGLFALPAAAQSTAEPDQEARVVMSGAVDVPEGQTSGSIVIFEGPVTVAGRVEGSVVAFEGPVTISGEVTGSVVAFAGGASVEDGAVIRGDLVSTLVPRVAEGATIEGDVERFQTRPSAWGLEGLSWFAFTLTLVLTGLLLLLVAPRGMDAAVAVTRARPGVVVAVGFAVLVGVPVLGVLALISVVAIPFGVVLLLALAAIYLVGFATGAWMLGRLLLAHPRPRWLALLAGVALVQVAALVPVVGGLVALAALVTGLGAIALAIAAARNPRRAEQEPAAPAPVAPAPAPAPALEENR